MPEPTDTTGSTPDLAIGERVRIITGSVGRYYGATGTVLGLCTERHHHLARVHLDGTDEAVYVRPYGLERESAAATIRRV
jgi:hypothetical protein